MIQVKIVKSWLKKRRHSTISRWLRCEKWCSWTITWPSSSSSTYIHEQDDDDVDEDYNIPRDVPKGHLAVYVGENQTRFVINVKLLKDPLFKALLDQAQEEYNFTTAGCRLYIPCHEDVFLSVVRCAAVPQDHRRVNLCL